MIHGKGNIGIVCGEDNGRGHSSHENVGIRKNGNVITSHDINIAIGFDYNIVVLHHYVFVGTSCAQIHCTRNSSNFYIIARTLNRASTCLISKIVSNRVIYRTSIHVDFTSHSIHDDVVASRYIDIASGVQVDIFFISIKNHRHVAVVCAYDECIIAQGTECNITESGIAV